MWLPALTKNNITLKSGFLAFITCTHFVQALGSLQREQKKKGKKKKATSRKKWPFFVIHL